MEALALRWLALASLAVWRRWLAYIAIIPSVKIAIIPSVKIAVWFIAFCLQLERQRPVLKRWRSLVMVSDIIDCLKRLKRWQRF
jgi:hypothetical protein